MKLSENIRKEGAYSDVLKLYRLCITVGTETGSSGLEAEALRSPVWVREAEKSWGYMDNPQMCHNCRKQCVSVVAEEEPLFCEVTLAIIPHPCCKHGLK